MSVDLSEEQVYQIFPLLKEVQNKTLQSGIIEIVIEIANEMAWESFHDIPKNLAYEKNRSLLVHINGVTEIALKMAEMYKDNQGLEYDRDLLIASCLLHDISKPVESEPDPNIEKTIGSSVLPVRKSELGKYMPHASYAAHKVLSKKLGVRLAHIVTTHTHASNVRGKGWEASLLFYADFVDTDAGIVMAGEGSPMYSQRWKL